jgi:hypothetical protein
MAIVILPLLPEGPFGPLGGIKPRELWLLVLFFTGLSFIGYLAQQGFDLENDHVSRGDLSRAVIYGSVMGSFCCEQFGEAGKVRLPRLVCDLHERFALVEAAFAAGACECPCQLVPERAAAVAGGELERLSE